MINQFLKSRINGQTPLGKYYLKFSIFCLWPIPLLIIESFFLPTFTLMNPAVLIATAWIPIIWIWPIGSLVLFYLYLYKINSH